jgi:hypothetical protein
MFAFAFVSNLVFHGRQYWDFPGLDLVFSRRYHTGYMHFAIYNVEDVGSTHVFRAGGVNMP